MASYDDQDTLPSAWLNITSVVGGNAGNNFRIENKGSPSILVETSSVEPPSPNRGLTRSHNENAITSCAVDEFVWVYTIGSTASKIGVDEIS